MLNFKYKQRFAQFFFARQWPENDLTSFERHLEASHLKWLQKLLKGLSTVQIRPLSWMSDIASFAISNSL